MPELIRRGPYLRRSIHTIEEVLNMVGNGIVYEADHCYNTNSDRLILFRDKGITCVSCGIVGVFFAKEKDRKDHNERYHFNLYAYNSNGNIVLMTKDHIRPKSRGGKDCQENYQPMCAKCNREKGCEYKPKEV
jgi:5-methylcytosine-specific restriction endonuclease McrA